MSNETIGRILRRFTPARPGALAALTLCGAVFGCGAPESEEQAAAPAEVTWVRSAAAPEPGGEDARAAAAAALLAEDEGAEAGASRARLSLSATELRYWPRCPGASGRKTLSLQNEGGSTLIIRGLAMSGRAFSLVDAPALPRRIGSGERLELTVKFSPPADRPDQLQPTGSLRITSNDSSKPTASIALRGAVPPMSLGFFPAQLDLGEIAVGQARSGRVQLRNGGACALTIGWFDTSGALDDSILVDDIEELQLQPGGTRRLKVTGLCDRRGDIDAKLRFYTPGNVPLGAVPVVGTCD